MRFILMFTFQSKCKFNFTIPSLHRSLNEFIYMYVITWYHSFPRTDKKKLIILLFFMNCSMNPFQNWPIEFPKTRTKIYAFSCHWFRLRHMCEKDIHIFRVVIWRRRKKKHFNSVDYHWSYFAQTLEWCENKFR